MAMQNDRKFFTANQLAERYHTKPLQIYEWKNNQTIPPGAIIRIGRKLLFDAEKILAWEAQGGTMSQNKLLNFNG